MSLHLSLIFIVESLSPALYTLVSSKNAAWNHKFQAVGNSTQQKSAWQQKRIIKTKPCPQCSFSLPCHSHICAVAAHIKPPKTFFFPHILSLQMYRWLISVPPALCNAWHWTAVQPVTRGCSPCTRQMLGQVRASHGCILSPHYRLLWAKARAQSLQPPI